MGQSTAGILKYSSELLSVVWGIGVVGPIFGMLIMMLANTHLRVYLTLYQLLNLLCCL